jgi:hypothetical protein
MKDALRKRKSRVTSRHLSKDAVLEACIVTATNPARKMCELLSSWIPMPPRGKEGDRRLKMYIAAGFIPMWSQERDENILVLGPRMQFDILKELNAHIVPKKQSIETTGTLDTTITVHIQTYDTPVAVPVSSIPVEEVKRIE